ncbi:MAG: DUF1993 domain-containing protein [Caulobacterales bacterium]|jgi:hypothetical protein
MASTLYAISAPVYVRMLANLAHILDKAAVHAAAKKIDEAVFVSLRLAPDMFPLARQVQIACDISKFGMARLAGVDAPRHPDEEKTFAELKDRIAKTQAFFESLKPEQINGKETDILEFKVGPPGNQRDMRFTGADYVQAWITPNLYFHIAAAYGILRSNGVDVGKADFLGG